MIRIIFCAVIALLACAGCGSSDKQKPIAIGPPEQGLQMRMEDGDTSTGSQTVRRRPSPSARGSNSSAPSITARQPTGANTLYLKPAQAMQCPQIQVTGSSGRSGSLNLAQRNNVTLVVCWDLERRSGRAAATYAQQLKRKYGGLNVVGLALKLEQGPRPIYAFANASGLDYSIYHVDKGALRTLASTVGGRAASVGFFLIDSAGRVRMYRKGFTFTASGVSRGPGTIQETAAPGRRVDDYVRNLLESESGQRSQARGQRQPQGSGFTGNAGQQTDQRREFQQGQRRSR